ncbi:hypothetical protein ACJRO7_026427 [Eucalyptus globulus]|uniref:RBR-type E3 ubiquitin transferase n=1 Tax=Eucalyptus globulus TaxID=34317 RepID=A0ABD3JQP8_EUCGL
MSANLFWIKGCSHAYYIHCIAKYAISKLDNNMTRIDCPVSGYDGVLETEYCRLILSPEVFNHWGITLCRAGILEDKRFYCPHKDCLALLIRDQGTMVVMEWECPNCRRLFCAQYNVSWHARMECHEAREDIMLMQLAKKQNWRICPRYNFYVEKIDGCAFMTCRCGVEFCYRCGARSETLHYSSKCQG